MNTSEMISHILIDVLHPQSPEMLQQSDAGLMGVVPEFDSMAVVSLITTLEDHFDIEIHDDEIEAEIFETVGSLTDFIQNKLAQTS